jgi:hypothetical protein
MLIQPGKSTTLAMEFMMQTDMGGKHDLRVRLPSNDPVSGDTALTVLSNWVE